MYGLAASASAINASIDAENLLQQGIEKQVVAVRTASVQRFCQLAVVLAVDFGYIVVGYASSRIISSALRKLFTARQIVVGQAAQLQVVTSDSSGKAHQSVENEEKLADASAMGRRLQVKVSMTFAVVSAAAVIRSVYDIMHVPAFLSSSFCSSASPFILPQFMFIQSSSAGMDLRNPFKIIRIHAPHTSATAATTSSSTEPHYPSQHMPEITPLTS
jgi:hypothetical protein